MNLVDQFLGWLHGSGTPGTAGSPAAGWLDWFTALSRGWAAAPQAAPPTAAAPQPTGKQTSSTEQTSVQLLTALLDRFTTTPRQ